MKLKTVIIFYPEPSAPRKYRKVQRVEKLLVWLNSHGAGNWSHANLYDSKTKEFIEQIKNEGESQLIKL